MSDTGGAPLSAGIDPFSATVRRWCEEVAPSKADAVYQAIVQDFLARLKERTPVRTGYLRASWTVVRAGDSAPSVGATGIGTDPGQTIAELHYGDGVVIVNPVVYARRIEYGFAGTDSLGRHYNEKGRGMLAATVAELPEIAAAAAARVSSEGP